MGDKAMTYDLRERLHELREGIYVMSVDSCCFCGDCECDGVSCIASIDVDLAGAGDTHHFEAQEQLHELLRQGQAWRAMTSLMDVLDPAAAFLLAQEALAEASNQTTAAECVACGHEFSAQGPCDDRCTDCRIVALSGGVS